MTTWSQAAKNEIQAHRAKGGKCYEATPDLSTGCSNCAEGWQMVAFIVGGPFDSPQQSRPDAVAYTVDGLNYHARIKSFACPICGVATGRQVEQETLEAVWS